MPYNTSPSVYKRL